MILSFRVQVAPGGVELRPRRSREVRGSPELQNGSLRALEEAWMTTFRLRHFPVKSGRFLCSAAPPGGSWLEAEARSKWVEAGGWKLEAFSWRLGLGARGSIKRGFGEQECSTSFPGGNLVDGLPPVSSLEKPFLPKGRWPGISRSS